MSLLTVLLSLTLPLASTGSSLTKTVAWVACLACAAMAVYTSRRFSSVVIVSLALTFIISYVGDPTPVAILLGSVIACGIYGAAVAAARRVHVLFLVCAPLLSVAVTYMMTSSIVLSAFSVVHLIPALAMGLGARRKKSRSHTVALFAIVSAAVLGGTVLLYVYVQNGRISRDVIEYAVEYLRGAIEYTLRSSIERAGAVEINESLILQIREMSTQLVNLLPGIVAVIALTLGFFVQKIACSLFESYGEDDLFEAASAPISASLTAALVFVAAHVFSYTSSASSAPSFFAIASENISLVLLPALMCIGFETMAALPRKIGFLALAAWIGVILASTVLSISIMTVLALIGAFCIFFVRTDSWAKDHYANKGEDQ